EQNDRHLRVFADVVEHFETAALRKHQIEQDEVRLLGVKQADRFLAVRGLRCLVVFEPEVDLQPLPEAGFIFDDQNLGHAMLLRMAAALPRAPEPHAWMTMCRAGSGGGMSSLRRASTPPPPARRARRRSAARGSGPGPLPGAFACRKIVHGNMARKYVLNLR